MRTGASATSPSTDQVERGATTQADRRWSWAAIAGLLVVSLGLRFPGLGPSSLWFDDAWAALVVKADSVGEALLPTLTSVGMSLVLAVAGWGAGTSSVALQAVPFVCGVAAPVALFVLLHRRGIDVAGAVVGGGLLAASPVLAVYSTRVKHYTMDALLAVGLLWVAWRVVDEPDDAARWFGLTVAAVVSTALSATVAPVVASAFAAGALAGVLRSRHGVSWRRPLMLAGVSTGAYGAFALVWWQAVLASRRNPELTAFWEEGYVRLSSPATAVGDLAVALDGVANALVAGPRWVDVATMLVIAVVGVWLVARRPALAVTAFGPVAVGVVLAVMRLYPLGGGRTDAHLLPGLALAIGLAAGHASGWARESRGWSPVPVTALAAAAVVVLAAATWRLEDLSYPRYDVRPLVSVIEARAEPDDTIALYALTWPAYALYTPSDVDFVPGHQHPIGTLWFGPDFEDARVTLLRRHADDPERYTDAVAELVGEERRVWLLATNWGKEEDSITQAFEAAGFHAVERISRAQAHLFLWERQV